MQLGKVLTDAIAYIKIAYPGSYTINNIAGTKRH